jgi:hypothetical protein
MCNPLPLTYPVKCGAVKLNGIGAHASVHERLLNPHD